MFALAACSLEEGGLLGNSVAGELVDVGGVGEGLHSQADGGDNTTGFVGVNRGLKNVATAT